VNNASAHDAPKRYERFMEGGSGRSAAGEKPEE
jgi:hypothetical protein